MRKAMRIGFLGGAGAVAIIALVAGIALHRLQTTGTLLPLPPPDVMYPPAPAMPAVAAEPVEALLARWEATLAAKAPAVLASLQPGLSDAEMDALQSTHQFVLTPDLRALYRWRNGTRSDVALQAFPDHHFLPLDRAVADRDVLRKQVAALPGAQQRTYATVAGHRDAWLGLIVDAAGDGHFFDPGRAESAGSFFFCFAEDGSYTFYPAFRNYLAAVVEGFDVGLFAPDPHGIATTDFVRAETIWNKYGAPNR